MNPSSEILFARNASVYSVLQGREAFGSGDR